MTPLQRQRLAATRNLCEAAAHMAHLHEPFADYNLARAIGDIQAALDALGLDCLVVRSNSLKVAEHIAALSDLHGEES
jgi:hypothetical protein